MTVYERMTREGVEAGVATTPDAARLIERQRVNRLAHAVAGVAARIEGWARRNCVQGGHPASSLDMRDAARELARIAVALNEGDDDG